MSWMIIFGAWASKPVLRWALRQQRSPRNEPGLGLQRNGLQISFSGVRVQEWQLWAPAQAIVGGWAAEHNRGVGPEQGAVGGGAVCKQEGHETSAGLRSVHVRARRRALSGWRRGGRWRSDCGWWWLTRGWRGARAGLRSVCIRAWGRGIRMIGWWCA